MVDGGPNLTKIGAKSIEIGESEPGSTKCGKLGRNRETMVSSGPGAGPTSANVGQQLAAVKFDQVRGKESRWMARQDVVEFFVFGDEG